LPNDTYLPPVCASCLEHDGLCVRHLPEVCPQLKQPSWHRHAHSGKYYEVGKDKVTETAAVKKAKRRNDRRQKRAVAGGISRKNLDRFARALRGEFTPCRPPRAAA
jgi:hypothetical protein